MKIETVADIESDLAHRSYQLTESAAFRRSRDAYGQLSNMTWGYPLNVNGLTFQGPEGLYQAMKFPDHPEIQRSIAAARSGMEAKRAAYDQPEQPMAGWDQLRIQAMALTLAIKLMQHPAKFERALRETVDRDIVENSHRDPFWGARPVPGGYSGTNVLGRLLTALRNHLDETGEPEKAADRLLTGVKIDGFTINGRSCVQ